MTATSGTARDASDQLSLRGTWWLILALLALAVLVRLVGWDAAHADDGWHLIDPDSQYHARRIALVRANFPSLPPAYDPLVAYPSHYPVLWPPGLAVLGGGLSWAFGVSVDATGSWLMVLFGAALVVPVVFLARLLGPRGMVAPAGLIAALHPMFVEYSRVGRIDHHVFEPLGLAAGSYFILRAVGRTDERTLDAWVGGGVLGASFWFLPSALYPAVVVLCGLLLVSFVRRDDALAQVGIRASLSAALVLTPLLLVMPTELRWALQAPAMVPLALLLTTTLGYLAVRALLRASREVRGGRLRYFVGVPAVWTVLAALALLLVGEDARSLALRFGARKGLWSLLLEQRPLFSLPIDHVRVLATYVLLALPVTVTMALRDRLAERPVSARWWLLGCWLLLVLPLGLLQLRFMPLLIVYAAPFSALGTLALARMLLRQRPTWIPTVTVLLMAIQLTPSIEYLGLMRRPAGKERAREALGHALARLPVGAGTGAVIGPLSVGHHIVRFASRPVVASPLIEPNTAEANRAAIDFMLTDDWERARQIVHDRNVEWVVSEPVSEPRYARRCARFACDVDSYAESVIFLLATERPPPWLQLVWVSAAVPDWGRIRLYAVVRRGAAVVAPDALPAQ